MFEFLGFKKKKCKLQELLLLLLCCHFCSFLFIFVIAVVKLTKLMAREQRLSSIVDMVKKTQRLRVSRAWRKTEAPIYQMSS